MVGVAVGVSAGAGPGKDAAELGGFTIPAIVGAAATAFGVAQGVSMALLVLAGGLLLATVGFAHGLVLRRHVDRSGSWVVANALAVVSAAIGIAPRNSPVVITAFGVAGGFGRGLTVALVTGLFLVRLLDRANPASHTREPLTTS